MGLVVLLLLIALGLWMYREYAKVRSRDQTSVPRQAQPAKPPPPRHQRVSDRELDKQVKVLRTAVERGDITFDEAVGSLVRTAGLTEDLARAKLKG